MPTFFKKDVAQKVAKKHHKNAMLGGQIGFKFMAIFLVSSFSSWKTSIWFLPKLKSFKHRQIKYRSYVFEFFEAGRTPSRCHPRRDLGASRCARPSSSTTWGPRATSTSDSSHPFNGRSWSSSLSAGSSSPRSSDATDPVTSTNPT